MAPKNPTAPSAPPSTSTPKAAHSSSTATPQKPAHRHTPSGSIRSTTDLQNIGLSVWNTYQQKTEQRTKLLDAFMAFLVVVGAVQFAYVVVVGNYPFNAFLAGFSATVGQFVLTTSLRMQTNAENKEDFHGRAPERAFADFVFGSMILHFFCVNFIN